MSNNTDDFIREFHQRYMDSKSIREKEIGRKLHSSDTSGLRYLIRSEMRERFPVQVEAVDYYYARSLEFQRKTGRPFPSNAEMSGDAKWLRGASIEQALRAMSLSTGKAVARQKRATKGVPDKNEQYNRNVQERLGNVRIRYYNMVKKYGYVPADEITSSLAGITHRMALDLRVALSEEFTLTDHQHDESVHAELRPYWMATPKEDTTAKLVDIIQGLDEDNRKALIELLASIKNGSS